MNQSKDITNARIWGTATAVLLAGAIFLLFQYGPDKESSSPLTVVFDTMSTDDNTPSDSQPKLNSGKTYTDSLGFSFIHPKDWVVGRFPEGEDGIIVIVQDPQRINGFQVYITPFTEEDTTLTPERLLNEIPDLIIEDAQPIAVADGGTGITFISDYGSGQTREVWFIYHEYLYQLSTPLSAQSILQEVLATWKF